MPSAREIFVVDLRGLKAVVLDRAREQHLTASEWARRAIGGALNARSQPVRARHAVNAKGGCFVRISVRLGASDAASLARLAEHEGLSKTGYLLDLIGQAVAGADIFADSERVPGRRELMAALVKSNSELAAIGRNLNQVARSLNSWPGRTTAADRDAIAATIAAVTAHLGAASSVLEALSPRRRSQAGHQSQRPA